VRLLLLLHLRVRRHLHPRLPLAPADFR
jgi:hypothetical protein